MSVEVNIPRYIDSQGQFFQWEFDEFIVGAGIFIIGIVMKFVVTSLILGWLCIRWIRRWKEGELDGALAHIVFWVGAIGLNKVFEDGLETEFWV